MSNANSSASSGGVGFFGLLAILFIALKLTGYIDWSWWWVLSPIWGVALFIIGLLLVVAIVALFAEYRKSRRSARRLRP